MKIFTLILMMGAALAGGSVQVSGMKWVSAQSGLRMRDSPDLMGAKLESIPYNEKVTVLEVKDKTEYLANTSGKWTKVNWQGKTGWVYGGFLSDMKMDVNKMRNHVGQEFIDFYFNKMDEAPVLARVEVEGYGYTLNDDGTLTVGIYDDESGQTYMQEYDISYTYHFEYDISITFSEGYEWGSETFRIHNQHFSLEEAFELAAEMYREKYGEFLSVEDGRPILPVNEQKFSRTVDYIEVAFTVEMFGRNFSSMRIEETDGCGSWWHFKVDGNYYEFGSGGGC